MATKRTAKAAEETTEQATAAAEENVELVTAAEEETTEMAESTADEEEEPMKLYKVKVKTTFRDKNTGKIVRAGTVIMVDQKRYKELTDKKKFVEKM